MGKKGFPPRNVNFAFALSLFGGVAKDGGSGTHRVRGDINILLLGKCVQRISIWLR